MFEVYTIIFIKVKALQNLHKTYKILLDGYILLSYIYY